MNKSTEISIRDQEELEELVNGLKREASACRRLLGGSLDQLVLADSVGGALFLNKEGGWVAPCTTMEGLFSLPLVKVDQARKMLAHLKAANPRNPEIKHLEVRRLHTVVLNYQEACEKLLENIQNTE